MSPFGLHYKKLHMLDTHSKSFVMSKEPILSRLLFAPSAYETLAKVPCICRYYKYYGIREKASQIL